MSDELPGEMRCGQVQSGVNFAMPRRGILSDFPLRRTELHNNMATISQTSELSKFTANEN